MTNFKHHMHHVGQHLKVHHKKYLFGSLFGGLMIKLMLVMITGAGIWESTQVAHADTNFDCSTIQDVPNFSIPTCQALVDIYNNTNGSGRTNSSEWLINHSYCSWYGVSCHTTRVFKIELGNNNLSGNIPSSIVDMSRLTELYLQNNNITSLPASIGSTPVLGVIHINSNPQLNTLPGSLIQLLKSSPNLIDNFIVDNTPINQLLSSPQLFTSSNFSGSLLVSGNQYVGFSGASWDGSFVAPQPATGTKIALAGESGLNETNPILTIEVGSTTADLLPYTGYFIISAKVANGFSGQEVTIYRSNYNDGEKREINRPDRTCTLDSNKMCTFQTDHLSLFALGISDFDCANVTDVSTGECNALVDLYVATDGDHWTNSGGWLVNTEVCNRYGVACDANRVSSLNVQNNNLSGDISSSIGNLIGLTYLYLGGNSIVSLPSSMGNLTGLTQLYLNHNQISSLPVSIGNLTHLTLLLLNNNQIPSLPTSIGNLTSLTHLYLEDNQISSLPTEIRNLSNLQELKLHNNQISSLPAILFNIRYQNPNFILSNGSSFSGINFGNHIYTGSTVSGSLLVSGNVHIGYSGGTRDGTFLAPQLATGSKMAATGEAGLVGAPLLTIEAGSSTTDLIPYTGTFTISVKVESGNVGQILKIYRSNYNDGDTWAVNSPTTECTLDSNKMCIFQTNHLSLFTIGTTTPTIVSQIISFFGGGGAGGGTAKDNCLYNAKNKTNLPGANTEGKDYSPSYYDDDCGISPTHSATESSYADELKQAYTYAYTMGITTTENIDAADMLGSVMRKHMAKMISQYATNVLKMKPNTSKKCVFNDIKNEEKEMQDFAIKACQLGLMGINSDGSANTKFNPNGIVTRAQFGTMLSRVLYGETYNSKDAKNRYKSHLNALKTNGIMNDISKPTMIEKRGYVMLMFMRTGIN